MREKEGKRKCEGYKRSIWKRHWNLYEREREREQKWTEMRKEVIKDSELKRIREKISWNVRVKERMIDKERDRKRGRRRYSDYRCKKVREEIEK